MIRLPILALLLSLPSVLPAAERPNVLVVLADDLGYSDLGCYGGEIATPHLDALAEGGLRFKQFYNGARCCPTRAQLMTGLYAHQTGIGHMIIADFDIVEPSNLNRQQYFIDQIGLPKVYALRDTLVRINPHVRVTACHLRLTAANIAEVLGHAQILAEAFDLAEQKVMLVEAFAARFPDRPIVTGSGMAGYGPSNNVQTRQVAANLYLCGDGTTAAAPGTGLMAPRVGIAAHHQANAVLRLLLGQDPAVENS